MSMISKEQIEACGWLQIKDYTHSGEGYRYQLLDDDDSVFWEMEWLPDTSKMKIEKYTAIGDMKYDSNTIMEGVKIHDKQELLGEMSYLGITSKTH